MSKLLVSEQGGIIGRFWAKLWAPKNRNPHSIVNFLNKYNFCFPDQGYAFVTCFGLPQKQSLRIGGKLHNVSTYHSPVLKFLFSVKSQSAQERAVEMHRFLWTKLTSFKALRALPQIHAQYVHHHVIIRVAVFRKVSKILPNTWAGFRGQTIWLPELNRVKY